MIRYNECGECLVQHHIKYEEIHGFDEIVWMTMSEHVKLHNRIRAEHKCPVPPDVVKKISQKAHHRNLQRGKNIHSAEYKKRRRDRSKKMVKNRLYFSESVGVNAQLDETLEYNPHTGRVFVYSSFKGLHGYTIPTIVLGGE